MRLLITVLAIYFVMSTLGMRCLIHANKADDIPVSIGFFLFGVLTLPVAFCSVIWNDRTYYIKILRKIGKVKL